MSSSVFTGIPTVRLRLLDRLLFWPAARLNLFHAAVYFWKIIFPLHLLVPLTLTCFFFPGDDDGVGIRISISSTM